MTPEQVALVEATLQEVRPRLDEVAAGFYERLVAADPDVAALFTGDPVLQRSKFTSELDTICRAIRDHAAFLKNSKRYAKAFAYPKNPNQFAAEIHKAGYATDPGYTTKLVNLMKQYDLYRYDV